MEKMKESDKNKVKASQSGVKRVNLTAHYFKKAYENDSKVIYVNSFMPTEIFWALDLIPFNLGAIGGILSQGKAARKFINVAQQNHYSNDLCSTSRCLLGAAFVNALPSPDFLGITSAPCDVGTNIYYFLSQFYEKEWFLLDIPCYSHEESISYLANQVKSMVTVIEKTLNVKLEPEKLKNAINYSNEAAVYLQKTNELAKRIPSPLSAAESMEIASSLHLLGSKDMVDVCKERYEEIDKKIQDKKTDGNRKPRIIWHGLRPFYSSEIFQHLENNCQVEIISEININMGSSFALNILNPDEPYQGLAKKMIMMIEGVSLNNHLTVSSEIVEKMKEYSIDGMISFYSRGCRHMSSIHQVIRDTTSKNNLPCLDIDGDYIDDRDYSFEQIKTRIDAFAELLHGKIGG